MTELWYQTGSRAICNPKPMDTDDDYVVLTGSITKFIRYYNKLGFQVTSPESEEDYGNQNEYTFVTMRGFDDKNLIVTEDSGFYRNWVKATKLARKLNLLNKEDRIALFSAILYDKWPEE